MNSLATGISDRLCLVTGASSGLGAHFAHVLADAGARVVLAARRREQLEAQVSAITASGGKASALTMDVTCPESVSEALARLQAEQGVVRILVNNAGMADARRFLKTRDEHWQSTLSVNLDGARRVAQQVSSTLVDTGETGCIVNIASILGLRVGVGHSAYAVSKAALIQLTRAMALELGPSGIRVNALCPGYFRTDMNAEFFATPQGQDYIRSTPAGRTGELSELDGPLLLLCGDAGSFINGVALPVDGGHLIDGL